MVQVSADQAEQYMTAISQPASSTKFPTTHPVDRADLPQQTMVRASMIPRDAVSGHYCLASAWHFAASTALEAVVGP